MTLNSTNSTSSCDVKSAEETRLEGLLESLNNELLNHMALVNETDSNYNQSINIYYDKEVIANTSFYEVLLTEQVVKERANNTIESFNAVTSGYEAIPFDGVANNNTLNSLNSSLELLYLQNETYTQSLLDGDPDKIQQAEAALNLTLEDLVSQSVCRIFEINNQLMFKTFPHNNHFLTARTTPLP